MASWYCVRISEQAFTAQEHVNVQDAFFTILAANGSPRGASLWQELHPIRTGQMGTSLYFSPDAAKIAGILVKQLNGVPCPTPQLGDLALFVGNGNPQECFAAATGIS
jgi:hypothetical protein